MKSQYQKFDTLVSKLLDGSVSTSEFAELNNMLVSSTDLQHRYCSFIRNESIFHWENESTVSNDEPKIINFPFFPMLQVSQQFWFVLLVLGSCIQTLSKSPFTRIN